MGNTAKDCCILNQNSSSKFYSSIEFPFVQLESHIQINQNVSKRLKQLQKEFTIQEPLHHEQLENLVTRKPMKHINKHFIYEGQWYFETLHGYGKIYFKNGDYFEGEFRNGIAQGYCRLIFNNGNYFQGNIIKNKAQGQGKFISDQIIFTGIWHDSKACEGTYTYPNQQDKIIVECDDSGTIFYKNGNIYKGRLKDLKCHGIGILSFKNGNIYEGQWCQDFIQGQGQFKWIDGSTYKGQYSKGIKHGYGKYIYKNKIKYYQGQWYEGKQHGFGKIIQNDKVIMEGILKNNIFENQAVVFLEFEEQKNNIQK